MRTLDRPLRSLLVAAVLLVGSAAQVRAQETPSNEPSPDATGFYATLGVGAAWPQNVTGSTSVFDIDVSGDYSLDPGVAVEVGAGYDFGVVRAELTYLYNNATLNSLRVSALGQSVSASISNGGVNTNSVMASAYVDIPTKSRIVPYVGGGLGYTNVSWGSYNASAGGLTLSQSSGGQGVLGYQGKVGVSYRASKEADVFLEATYQGTAGFSVESVSYDPLSSWGARLGARYRF